MFYLSNKERLEHYRSIHPPSTFQKHACTKCSSNLSSSWSLKRHQQNGCAKTHTAGLAKLNNNKIACKVPHCEKVFVGRTAFLYHMNDRHLPKQPRVSCLICNRSLKNAMILRMHMRSCHHQFSPALTPAFHCEKCNRNFNNEQSYKWHFQHYLIHKIDSDSPPLLLPPTNIYPTVDVGNMFLCDICMKTFAYKDSLTRHLLFSMEHRANVQYAALEVAPRAVGGEGEKRKQDKEEGDERKQEQKEKGEERKQEKEEEELEQFLRELLATEDVHMHTCVWCEPVRGGEIQYTWDELSTHIVENHFNEGIIGSVDAILDDM